MAYQITNDDFQQLFLKWCRSQQVNRGVRAAFSLAFKSKGEVPLDLLKVALQENLKPSVFAARLQASGYDVALVWSLLQAAEKENEVKVEKTKPQEADLKDGAEAKTEAEEVAPESNKVVIVPPSVAAASKPKFVIQRSDPAVETAIETAAQSDMEGADFKAADSPEPKADESASTGEVSVGPRKLMRRPVPGVAGQPTVSPTAGQAAPTLTEPEPKGPKALFEAISNRFNEWRSGLSSGKKKSVQKTIKRGDQKDNEEGVSSDNAISKHFGNSWQAYVFLVIALLVFWFVFKAVDQNGGEVYSQSITPPSTSIDTIKSFPLGMPILLIIFVIVILEATSRYDPLDAVTVLISVVSSMAGVYYQNQLIGSFVDNTGKSWGTGIYWFLVMIPYVVVPVVVISNKTENPYSARFLSRFDFSAAYNTLFVFWALAKMSLIWAIIPNPCIFPPEFYLLGGVTFMLLEISGNKWELIFSITAGLVSGFFLMEPIQYSNMLIVVSTYFILVVLSFIPYFDLTKEITVIVPPKRGDGGVLGGVEKSFLLPYDMYASALWIAFILVVTIHGNPVVPF